MKKKMIIFAAFAVIVIGFIIFFAFQYTPKNVLNLSRAEELPITDEVLVIPIQYTVIDAEAFAGRTEFSRIEIKGSTAIGERCFYGCQNLTTVIIEGECTVGSEAFADCGALSLVQVNSIGTTCETNAFDGHSGIVIYCRENSPIVEVAQKNDISYKIIGEN